MLRAVDVKAVIDMRGLMGGVVFDSRDGALFSLPSVASESLLTQV